MTPFSVDDARVDVGASAATGARALGVSILTPVTLSKKPLRYGSDLLAAPMAGRRAACAALVLSAARGEAGNRHGRGGFRHGAEPVRARASYGAPYARTVHPGAPGRRRSRGARSAHRDGRGMVASGGVVHDGGGDGIAAGRRLAARAHRALDRGDAMRRLALLATLVFLPCRAVRPATAITRRRALGAGAADRELRRLGHGRPGARGGERACCPPGPAPTTDSAGNLMVSVGEGEPLVVFVAHLDEIGFAISAIRDDGTLELEQRGGFFPSLFEAQPALVHTGGRHPRRVPAARLGRLRHRAARRSRSASTSGRLARWRRRNGRPRRSNPHDAQAVLPLAGTRATGRSFDDRGGLHGADPGAAPPRPDAR